MSVMGLGTICQGKQKGAIENEVFAKKCDTELIHRTHMVGRKATLTGNQLLKICKATNKKQ